MDELNVDVQLGKEY